jgi:hypothetical protein
VTFFFSLAFAFFYSAENKLNRLGIMLVLNYTASFQFLKRDFKGLVGGSRFGFSGNEKQNKIRKTVI